MFLCNLVGKFQPQVDGWEGIVQVFLGYVAAPAGGTAFVCMRVCVCVCVYNLLSLKKKLQR